MTISFQLAQEPEHIIELNYQTTNPAPKTVLDELTQATLYMLACKSMTVPLDGTHDPLDILSVLYQKIRKSITPMLADRKLSKSVRFDESTFVTIKKQPYLQFNNTEVGVIEFNVQRSPKFTNDDNVLTNHVRRVSWAFSILAEKTTFFEPNIIYPIIKSKTKELPGAPRAYFSADKSRIYMFLNSEHYTLAKKFCPDSISTKTLEQISADRFEEEVVSLDKLLLG